MKIRVWHVAVGVLAVSGVLWAAVIWLVRAAATLL